MVTVKSKSTTHMYIGLLVKVILWSECTVLRVKALRVPVPYPCKDPPPHQYAHVQ